ncbi:hypothetical protein QTI24_29625 [Variovorax sp. J22P240]|uniref:hypothetical protein n=1 Tax=Variovorax sp. J22P240 TaxID=3053514 RepID=UPI002574C77F|nr:hypothetical protein [Variovorax sp. J22P240]MDM0002787.1 hypothetical protein [Variovorax sp. J22P240]
MKQFGAWDTSSSKEQMMFARLSLVRPVLVLGAAALSIVSAAAQPTDRQPGPSGSETRPGTDREMVVKPPATVDPQLAKPPPPNKDPGMVEKPPADAAPSAGNTRPAPAAPSRRDDCKGTAEDCKQNSAR